LQTGCFLEQVVFAITATIIAFVDWLVLLIVVHHLIKDIIIVRVTLRLVGVFLGKLNVDVGVPANFGIVGLSSLELFLKLALDKLIEGVFLVFSRDGNHGLAHFGADFILVWNYTVEKSAFVDSRIVCFRVLVEPLRVRFVALFLVGGGSALAFY
jgi:hypothetical protein